MLPRDEDAYTRGHMMEDDCNGAGLWRLTIEGQQVAIMEPMRPIPENAANALRMRAAWNWWDGINTRTLFSLHRSDLVKALADARDALAGNLTPDQVRSLQLQLDAMVELLGGAHPDAPYPGTKAVPAGQPYPGPWREGRCGGSIVADHGRGSVAEVAAYGGHVVAETVLPVHQPLILAAPDFYSALVGDDPQEPRYTWLSALLAGTRQDQALCEAINAGEDPSAMWECLNQCELMLQGIRSAIARAQEVSRGE